MRPMLPTVPKNMAFPDRKTLNAFLTIVACLAVGAAVYKARHIILIFVFAIFFAYLINPVVRFLQLHSLLFHNVRGPAVIEVYLALVLLGGILAHQFAPSLFRNTVRAFDEIPGILNGLSTGDIAGDLSVKYGWSDQQEMRFRTFLARHRDDIQNLVRDSDRLLSNAIRVLALGLLIPILAIFLLRDGDNIADALIRMLFPTERRARVRALAENLHLMLTRYIRAQLILCTLSFLFYTAALLLLRFPHAFILGFLGGILEFIPVVGWVTTLAAISAVGIMNHQHWIWMAVLLGIWRLIQDYYATPHIMGNELKLHPFAALFAVLVGAEIGGIVGIYLAVPLVAAVWVIWGGSSDERSDDSSALSERQELSLGTPVA